MWGFSGAATKAEHLDKRRKSTLGSEMVACGESGATFTWRIVAAPVKGRDRVPGANVKGGGAKLLADFLLSGEIQKLLAEFGTKEYSGMLPFFYPIWPEGKEIPL
jgi:hypothetical protein